MKKLGILLILMVLLLVYTASAEPLYDVIDLGTAPGGGNSQAYSINNNGQSVGYSVVSDWERATLFDSTGGGNNINLGVLPGGLWSFALSINDSGQIVGRTYIPSINSRATLFDSTGDGNNINLGTIGGVYSAAYSINNSGHIAGVSYDASEYLRATLFDSTGDGNNIDLGTLGGSRSWAFSINEKNQIVGGAKNASGITRATLFDSTGAGNNIDLGIPGENYSFAYSINDKGQVVGQAIHAPGKSTATLFDSTGINNKIDLGTIPGGVGSRAESINNKGQIVGYASDSTGGNFRATIFDPSGNGNNIDLNTLIDPALGWILEQANCINDEGWIVCYGINPFRQTRAFLLIPLNTEPVADAGPNQNIYACIDEIVDVNLDGSGSYDDDGDELDYYWSWVIDGNVFEANGVSPTIQLPVGEYEIELIVDDGTDLSEPNYCTVTVGPLNAKLFCRPRFINTQSDWNNITAVICMPEGILPEDINEAEPLIFIPGEVESKRQYVFQWRRHGRPCTWIIASFDKDDCMDNLSLDMNRIKVVGRLNSGQCYYGNSSIYVHKPKPFRLLRKFPK